MAVCYSVSACLSACVLPCLFSFLLCRAKQRLLLLAVDLPSAFPLSTVHHLWTPFWQPYLLLCLFFALPTLQHLFLFDLVVFQPCTASGCSLSSCSGSLPVSSRCCESHAEARCLWSVLLIPTLLNACDDGGRFLLCFQP